ncbi:MAG: PilN domain-containing protein [bacterium]
MTIINLLPPEIIEKRKKRQQGIFIVSIVLLYAMILSGIGFYLNMKKLGLQANIKKIDEEIASLQPTLDKIKQIEAENAEINRRLSVIQTLIKGRFKWVKVLEEVSKTITITPDIWLSSLSPTEENGISLSCSGFSNYSVANFIVVLMENPFFSDITLSAVSSSGRESEEKTVTFGLTLKYNL